MNNKIYIIAGNFKEYLDYIKGSRIEYKYVDSELALRGVREPIVRLIGTYYNRKDFTLLKERLLLINAEIHRGIL